MSIINSFFGPEEVSSMGKRPWKESIKTHVEENKNIYIGALVMFVLSALWGLMIRICFRTITSRRK